MKMAPVLFIVFNRPDTTQKVFDKLRLVKPPKLYIAADGARPGNKNDEVKCKEVLDIVSQVDWDCEVHRNYSESNLGCCIRPSSAIDWVLSQEDRVIILEDDCLPTFSFFDYCTELLERYKDNERIMHISGTNYILDQGLNNDSYLFSRYQKCWGWATWKRAWSLVDLKMQSFEAVKSGNYFNYLFRDQSECDYWQDVFERTLRVNTIWDYQWQYAIFVNDGLCVVPRSNLISNLGFTQGTHSGPYEFFHLPIDENYKIEKHPEFIIRNGRHDDVLTYWFYSKYTIGERIREKFCKIFHIKRKYPFLESLPLESGL